MTDYLDKILGTEAANLIGAWPLDEAAGALTVSDYSSQNNDGAPSEVTFEQAGIGDGGTSARFNDTTSYIDIFSAGLAADFNGAEGTFMIWAYRENWGDSAYGVMFYCADAAYNDAVYMHKFTDNQIWLERIGDGTLKITKAPISGSGWKFIIGVWSEAGDYLKVYINNVQTGTPATSIGVYADAPNQFYIGAEDSHVDGWWGGKLAHAAIWTKVLTAEEILSLWKIGLDQTTGMDRDMSRGMKREMI